MTARPSTHDEPDVRISQMKTSLIELAKENSTIVEQKKALAAENNELKVQLANVKSEAVSQRNSFQTKIKELIAKCDSLEKQISLLDVSERKSQKTIIELKKQIVDLSDIKKRHQVVQNELADHMDNANEEKLALSMELRRSKEEIKELRLKLEAETNGKNKLEFDLDNAMRRLSSQDAEFKSKQLALVKEQSFYTEAKKKLEANITQALKKASDLELLSRSQQLKIKQLEQKLNVAYRSGTPSGSGSFPRPKTKSKKKRYLPESNSQFSLALQDIEDDERPESPSEEVPTLILEPAEVLIIGTTPVAERLASHLVSRAHSAINIPPSEVYESLTRKKYNIVVCWAKNLPELLSTTSGSFMEVYKKNQSGVPFFTFTMDNLDNIFRQLNNTHIHELSVHELVKQSALSFLHTVWCADYSKTLSDNFEKEKQLLVMSRETETTRKLQEELHAAQAAKKKFEDENIELTKVIKKLVDERTTTSKEIDNLKQKVNALCSKLFILELERDVGGPYNSLVRATSTSKVEEKAIAVFDSPMQTLTKLILYLLKDERYKDMHVTFQNILTSLTTMNVYSPDFQELFQEAGLDALTQSWMIYEFTREQKSRDGNLKKASSLTSNEEQLPTLLFNDKNAAELLSFDCHIYSVEELHSLFIYILKTLGVIDYFSIPISKLINFLKAVTRSYRKNPYHNFSHAFDVAQMCFRIIHNRKVMEWLTELDLLALFISALCHDLDHPGLNNNFQINDGTHLALLYNDLSVLENHHASRAFYIMNLEENNIFINLDESSYREIRKIIISAILTTDMLNHFELMTRFTTHLNTQSFSNKSPESRQLLVNVILHCADISNVVRPWDIAKKWSDEVLEEFLRQGDIEKEKQLLISPYMDRNNTDQPKMSLGFIDYMVAPIFTSLKKVIPELQECLDQLATNRAIWVERSNTVTAEQVMEEFKSSNSMATIHDEVSEVIPESPTATRAPSRQFSSELSVKKKVSSPLVPALQRKGTQMEETLKIKKEKKKTGSALPNIRSS